MSDAIDAAINALIRECGTVTPSGSVNQFLEADSVEDLRGGMIAAIAAYRDSEIEAMSAKLADCQDVIRDRGHDKGCGVDICERCAWSKELHSFAMHNHFDAHEFQPGPCSDACGYTRTTGEKS